MRYKTIKKDIEKKIKIDKTVPAMTGFTSALILSLLLVLLVLKL
jgi:hypothetical protein